MNTYTATLCEVIDELMASGEGFQLGDVATRMIEQHGELLRDRAEKAQYRQIINDAKTILRKMSDDDTLQQEALPGLGLPSAIAIPAETESGFVYKSSLNCTWDDLQGGIEVRRRHLQTAGAKYDQMVDEVEALRPEMEYDRTITVRQAIENMGRGRSA